jgi:hypothetical protein
MLLPEAVFRTEKPVIPCILAEEPIITYSEYLKPEEDGEPEHIAAVTERYRPLGTHAITNWGDKTRLFLLNSREKVRTSKAT